MSGGWSWSGGAFGGFRLTPTPHHPDLSTTSGIRKPSTEPDDYRKDTVGLTTLTEREKQWQRRAKTALDRDEAWEPCDDCLQFHPVGYDGSCDDLQYRLPGQPAEFVG